MTDLVEGHIYNTNIYLNRLTTNFFRRNTLIINPCHFIPLIFNLLFLLIFGVYKPSFPNFAALMIEFRVGHAFIGFGILKIKLLQVWKMMSKFVQFSSQVVVA